jgi:hypothetical protein
LISLPDEPRDAQNFEKDTSSEYYTIIKEGRPSLASQNTMLHITTNLENSDKADLGTYFSDVIPRRDLRREPTITALDETPTRNSLKIARSWMDEECFCAVEKLFCQNLELSDLNFIPRDVEFL